MPVLETVLLGLLAGWSVIAACFALGINGPRRIFARFNWFHLWVRWGLFNSDDPAIRPGVFEIEYRDRDPSGRTSPWRTGATGFFWSWRVAFWAPERALADSVQHFGKTVRNALDAGTSSTAEIARQAAALDRHLQQTCPPPPDTEREFRLIRRVCSQGPDLVYAFSPPRTRHGG